MRYTGYKLLSIEGQGYENTVCRRRLDPINIVSYYKGQGKVQGQTSPREDTRTNRVKGDTRTNRAKGRYKDKQGQGRI